MTQCGSAVNPLSTVKDNAAKYTHELMLLNNLLEKNMDDIEEFDKKETYCRKLGHFVAFNYCRKEKTGKKELPCAKILDCWFEKIPMQDFVSQHFTKKNIKYIFETSKPKITSILELIATAKKISE